MGGQLSSVLTLLILFPKLRLPVPCLFFYVIDMFSTQFCSSAGSDDCQVKQLKQELKLLVLASRASGTSENCLRAFNMQMGRVR